MGPRPRLRRRARAPPRRRPRPRHRDERPPLQRPRPQPPQPRLHHRTRTAEARSATPRTRLPAFDAYGSDEFTAAPYAAVREAIEEAGGAELGADLGMDYLTRVREAAPDDTVRAMVTELAVEAIRRRTVDEVYAGEQLVKVRLRAVERRIRDLQGTFTRVAAQGDQQQLASVQNELWVLQQYDRSLRNNGAQAL
ncbi:hypothetical protein ACFQVA_10805 [Actinomadura keratinilytica]